jgi:glycosyltransferase involved in cell wall biosynthesis
MPFLACLDGPGRLFPEARLAPECCLVGRKRRGVNFGVARVDLLAIAALRGFLRRNRIDVVHAHNLGPLVYGGLATRLSFRRPALLYSEHNQIYSASRGTRRKFRYYAKLADAVVAVSDDLRRTLLGDCGITAPIHVVPNGIDGSKYSPDRPSGIRRELGLTPEVRLVGTAVNLSAQKGLTHLLDAAAIVRRSGTAAHFVIAGDGPLRADLIAYAAAHDLNDSVTFAGYRADVPEVLAGLDVFVLSSLWEGLPLALLEALACGRPIVATSVGGIPEVVSEGENGFLVPPGDSQALASRILRVLGDPDEARQIGRNNVEKFHQRFSVGTMVAAHEQLYEQLADRRRDARATSPHRRRDAGATPEMWH